MAIFSCGERHFLHSGPNISNMLSSRTSLKASIKIITNLSDTNSLET